MCYLEATWTRSERRACGLVGINRSSCRYGGTGRDDGPLTARLRELEEENRRLKRLVAEQALDVLALKDVLSKNFGRPPSGGKS